MAETLFSIHKELLHQSLEAWCNRCRQVTYLHNVALPNTPMDDLGVEPVTCRYEFDINVLIDIFRAWGYTETASSTLMIRNPKGQLVMIVTPEYIVVYRTTHMTFLHFNGHALYLKIRGDITKEYHAKS